MLKKHRMAQLGVAGQNEPPPIRHNHRVLKGEGRQTNENYPNIKN